MIKSYFVNEDRSCAKGWRRGIDSLKMAVVGAAYILAGLFTATIFAQPTPATKPSTSVARRWELLAHGSGERLWLAVTTPANWAESQRTFVRERAMQGDWHDLNNFPSRLISLADFHGQLVVSLDNGEWKRISGDQFASGSPLPGHGEILALAGQDAGLWAVGFAEGARPETVSSTTTRTTGLQSAAAKPALPTTRPEQLQLYQLAADHWTHVAELPPEVRTAQGVEISLISSKGSPIIAYKESANGISMLRFNPENKSWLAAGKIKTSFSVRKLKLMSARDKVMAWAVGENGVGAFYFPQENQPAIDMAWREQLLSVPASVSVMDSAATAAGDELHLFIIRPDEEFVEQKYSLGGKEQLHSLTKLPPPTNPEETTLKELINWGLLGLLMVITLVTANKGGSAEVVTVEKVELPVATFGLRLAAGLIDLWPAYIYEILVVHHFQNGVKLSQLYTDHFLVQVGWILSAVYLLHMVAGEIFWGRTIGKFCVGLRVVAMNGQRAPIGSIVLRNLLKVIEVLVLVGFPLIVIFFNPLRQRIGDFAAGTVVIAKNPPVKEKDVKGEDPT